MFRKRPSPVFGWFVAREKSAEREARFREKSPELRVSDQFARLLNFGVASSLRSPNKPPEPTRTSVMSRAFESKMKCTNRVAQLSVAQAMPAVRVAHL